MPAKHRLRPDDDQSAPPARPDLGKPDPEHTVAPRQADPAPAESLLEHPDLLTQHDKLGLQGRSGAEQISQGTEEEAEHRVGALPLVRPASMIGVRMRYLGGTVLKFYYREAA